MFKTLKDKIKKMFGNNDSLTFALEEYSKKKININFKRILTTSSNGLAITIALKRINNSMQLFSYEDRDLLCKKVNISFQKINESCTELPENIVIEVKKITPEIIEKFQPTEIITEKEESFSTGLISLIKTPQDIKPKTLIMKTTTSMFDGFIFSINRLMSRLNKQKKVHKKIEKTLTEDDIIKKINDENMTMLDFEQIINSVLSQKGAITSMLTSLNLGNIGEMLKSVEQMTVIFKAMTIKEKLNYHLLKEKSRIDRISQNDLNKSATINKLIENWPNLRSQFKQTLGMLNEVRNNPAKMMEMLKNFKR